MKIKSSSCFSKLNGTPLTAFEYEFEAEDGANHARFKHGNKLSPYKCKKCGWWHLSPKQRQTPSTQCNDCIDSNGDSKALYNSYESAEKRADILYKEQGVSLRAYECPHNNGWHLTKSRA
jgi:hypothetical protein